MTSDNTRHTPGPVAYLYTGDDGSKELVLDPNGEHARRLLELGWTEMPLYAHAPDGELLAALDAITKVRVNGWDNIWAGANRCRDIARAAILKATGGGT